MVELCQEIDRLCMILQISSSQKIRIQEKRSILRFFPFRFLKVQKAFNLSQTKVVVTAGIRSS